MKAESNGIFQQAHRLQGAERTAVLRAVRDRLEEVGALRDPSWASRPWVQELLDAADHP